MPGVVTARWVASPNRRRASGTVGHRGGRSSDRPVRSHHGRASARTTRSRRPPFVTRTVAACSLRAAATAVTRDTATVSGAPTGTPSTCTTRAPIGSASPRIDTGPPSAISQKRVTSGRRGPGWVTTAVTGTSAVAGSKRASVPENSSSTASSSTTGRSGDALTRLSGSASHGPSPSS